MQQLVEQSGARPPGAPLSEPSGSEFATLQSRSIPPPPSLPAAIPDAAPSSAADLCQKDSNTQSFCLYVVQPGETLSGIAHAFGLSSTPAFSAGELVAWSNGLHMAEATTIQPGQELRVPRVTGVVHTVSSSEVLTGLAKQYGVSVESITSANNLSDPDSVGAGSDLLIPNPTSAPSLASESDEDEDDDTSASDEDEDDAARDDADEGDDRDDEPDNPAPVRSANSPSSLDDKPSTTRETSRETPLTAPATAPRQASTPNAVAEAFAAGFRSVGGSESILDHLLQKVIPCESSYNVRALNPIGPYYGLLQFLPSAWQAYGGGDWMDPWQQGANAARMLKAREARAQWPGCW